MVSYATSLLSWLGTATARLLACRDEESLATAVDEEVRRGLGVDRVGLGLADEQHGEWVWVLSCDEHGRPFRDPNRRYPLERVGEHIRLDRFADGRTVAYSRDLTPMLTPLQRLYTDGPIHEHLAVALRRQGEIVGMLSVDNLPSGRALDSSLSEPLGVFGQILAQAVELTRLQQVEHEARAAAERRAARDAALATLSSVVNTSLSPTIAARRAAATIREIVDGADQVWLWMVSDDQRSLRALAGDGASEDMMAAWAVLPHDGESCAVARAVEWNQAEFRDDAAGAELLMPPGFPSATLDRDVASYAILPLDGPTDVVGAMAVIGRRPHCFGDEERAFLQAVASRVGMALSNAQFVSHQKQAASRAARLLNMARLLSRPGSADDLVERVARLAAGVLGCDRCTVYLLNDAGTHYVPAACGGMEDEQAAAWRATAPAVDRPVFHRLHLGEPVLVDWKDLRPADGAACPSTAALLLPLQIGDRTIGVLGIDDSHQPHHFTTEEIALAQGMAHHVAAAIETARLYAEEARGRVEAERRAAEMSALVSGARLLIGAATPLELAADGVRTAMQTFQADASWAIACAPEPSPDDPLDVLAWFGLSATAARRQELPLGQLVAGRAALLRAPVAIAEAQQAAAELASVRADWPEIQSYLAVPMIAHDLLLGALVVAMRLPHDWTESEVALLQALANQMAAGLEAARLRDEAARREAGRAADRFKDELLSTVSHELRTPLGTIKGFATALLEYDTSIDAAERREFLHMIDDAADHLRGLVDDLLEASRLDAGGLRLACEPVDVTGLVWDTIRRMGARLTVHPIHVEIAAGLPTIDGDARRLRQVLENLLDNAVKYSRDGSPITIEAAAFEGSVRLCVRDHGIGIPVEHLPRVFERFHRVDSSYTRRVGGTGLGLAIARGLVEAHGGQVWAESAGEGRGTAIMVMLPITAPGAAYTHDHQE